MKERYINGSKTLGMLPLFHQPWWLDAVMPNGNWDVCMSFDIKDNITGVLPYCIERKWSLTLSRMPPLTPYLGPWMAEYQGQKRHGLYSWQMKIMKELIGQLPRFHYASWKFNPQIENWYPFYLNGYQQSTAYTYTLEHITETGSIWNGLKNTVRTDIRKAGDELIISSVKDVDLLYRLQEKTFLRQKSNVPYSKDLLHRIVDGIDKNQCGTLLFVYLPNGDPVAGQLLVWDQYAAYNLVMGMDDDKIVPGAIQFLIWHSIHIAAEKVSTYNFEGSMLPHVEPVFRHFGAKMTPYFKIWKDANRWIYLARTLSGR